MPTKKPPRAVDASGAPDWDKQHQFDVAFARRILLENGQVTPMFAVYTPSGVALMITPWSSPEEKADTVNFLRLWGVAEAAIGVGFITEAWVRTVRKLNDESEAEWKQRAQSIAPSEAPDRIETILITLEWRVDDEVKHRSTMHEIVRDAAGKPIATKLTSDFPDTMEGRFAHLLAPRAPSDADRAIARAALDSLYADQLHEIKRFH